jgi:hypothetical protein
MPDEIKSVAIIFFALSLLPFLACKNSALFCINSLGINKRFYPKYYTFPARWMRKVFKVKKNPILVFLYAELVLAIVFAALGPVNFVVAVYILISGYEKRIIGVLVMIPVCLIILNTIYLAVVEKVFK